MSMGDFRGDCGCNGGYYGLVGGFPGSGVQTTTYAVGNLPERKTKEERARERLERKEERLQRKEERHEKREQKRQEREERAKAKQEGIETSEKHEKHEKREKRQKKERFESAIIIEELPTDPIAHLYLDGNNMMFVANCLRNMTLHRNKKRVEQLMTRMAVRFLEVMPRAISKTTLVFDDTRARSEQTVRNATQETQDFVLCTARPHFTTSDDAIVQWLSEERGTTGIKLCVTSDRGLIERIEKEGGIVMKPKKWMLTAASLISGREVTDINEWMDQWVAEQMDL